MIFDGDNQPGIFKTVFTDIEGHRTDGYDYRLA